MEEKKRPIGTSILAVLHIAGGILGAIVTIYLVAEVGKSPEVQQGLAQLGLPPALLIVAVVFVLGLAIASGIGMWKGAKWGWYLGSFYYMYGTVRNAIALATIPMIISSIPPEELANMSRSPASYYVKHGGRVIIHFLLYLYFFKANVREFFSLTEQSRWKPVFADLGICIAFAAVFSIIAELMN